MRVETIGLQQDSTHRELKHILPLIDKYLCDINLRLVPVLTRKIDESMASFLNQEAIKYIHTYSSIKNEIEGISNIDNPLTPDSDLTICKLVVDIKTLDDE